MPKVCKVTVGKGTMIDCLMIFFAKVCVVSFVGIMGTLVWLALFD